MTFFQLKKIEIKNSNKCLEIFKSNNYLGFLVLIVCIKILLDLTLAPANLFSVS